MFEWLKPKKVVKVNKVIVEHVYGKYDESRILLVSDKKNNSVSIALYDNDKLHMENPWTLFMNPEDAKKLAEIILDILK